MKKEKTEGMKTKPAGGSNRAAFGQKLMPTNAKRAVSSLNKMLSSIRHLGRPGKGGSMPFGK